MKECISIKTDYSLLSSMIRISDLFDYAKNNNINTLGIIDNNLSSSIEFLISAKKNNIKPVIGLIVKYKDNEIYLYAKNERGLKDLFKLNTYLLDHELDIIELTKYISNLIIVITTKHLSLFNELNEIGELFIGYSSEEEKVKALILTDKIVYFNLALSITKEDAHYLNYLNMINDNLSYEEYNDKDYSNNYIKCADLSHFTNLINIELTSNKNLIPHYDNTIEDSYKYLEILSIKGF